MKHAGSICRYVGIKEIIQVFYTVCFIAEWTYSSIQAYQFNCPCRLAKLFGALKTGSGSLALRQVFCVVQQC